VQAALEALGAGIAGRVRGGGDLYALGGANGRGAERAGGGDELVETIRGLSQWAVGWSDQELRYQLRKRCGIDASLADVQTARAQLDGAAA
jgi:hypothetical protein